MSKKNFLAKSFAKSSKDVLGYEDLEYQVHQISKQEILRQYLPYLSILEDQKTILTKNGGLIRVVKVSGVDSANLSSDEKIELFNIRNNFLLSLNQEINLGIYHLRRKLSDVIKLSKEEIAEGKGDEDKSFYEQYVDKIENLWNQQFTDTFISEDYIVISKNFSALVKDSENFIVNLNIARKDLDARTEQLKSMLNKFLISDLSNSSSHLFGFLSYLINAKEFNLKGKEGLFNHLSLSDIAFNKRSGFIRIENDKSKKFSKIIGVRIGGVSSDENSFRCLQTINHEFTIIHQIKPYGKEQNRNFFLAKRKGLEQLPRFAAIQTRIDELSIASEMLESGHSNFLDYSCYIRVFGKDLEELNEAVTSIQNALASEGISSACETIGIILSFFATLPEMQSILMTLPTSIRARLTTDNVSDFVNFDSNRRGFTRSPFGDQPVCSFRSVSLAMSPANSVHKGNYNFTFHQDEDLDRSPGHTMIIGKTGTGKSTLAAFLLMNCLKFDNIKILCFDSLKGLKVPVKSFGGQYVTVGQDRELNLNPMRLDDSFANRNFQKKLIEMLAGGINDHEEAILFDVLRQNYILDSEDRSLENLAIAFGLEGIDEVTNKPTIASRIRKWVGTGNEKDDLYAKFFNNDKDNLDFSSKIAAFDMGHVLNDQELLAPTAFYIFHKFNQLIDKNPSAHIFFIDEMQKYLESANFNPHIISTIKESRKRNGIFIGCMQEASTLTESKNGDEIISNLATLIIFPNSKARKEHYIDGLNLTDSEFAFVKNHTNPRHVLIKKREGHSVVIDTDLSSLGQYLKLFSSKDTDRKQMEELLDQALTNNNGVNHNWIDDFLSL